MVLDPLTHTLFIFAGQRDNRYLSDMYAYDLESNTVTELFANFSAVGGPDACFTQRAVIDPTLKEIYVCVRFIHSFRLLSLMFNGGIHCTICGSLAFTAGSAALPGDSKQGH